MANYCSITRTNYFRVTDEERYKELIKKLTSEDDIITEGREIDGVRYQFIGSYGNVDYISEYDEERDIFDFNMDEFHMELQKILPEDEAFIQLIIGYEKLRYLVGCAVVVTSKDIKYINLATEALDTAKSLLNSPDWFTRIEY